MLFRNQEAKPFPEVLDRQFLFSSVPKIRPFDFVMSGKKKGGLFSVIFDSSSGAGQVATSFLDSEPSSHSTFVGHRAAVLLCAWHCRWLITGFAHNWLGTDRGCALVPTYLPIQYYSGITAKLCHILRGVAESAYLLPDKIMQITHASLLMSFP